VAGDLLALLDHLGLARAAVLGFSYGGLIAQRLLAAAPERVTRLIVASSSVLPVPADAFADWPERAERVAAEAAVWADRTLSGPALTRAAAVARAPADVWRPEARPGLPPPAVRGSLHRRVAAAAPGIITMTVAIRWTPHAPGCPPDL
jgi:pimeloyl-ACP methyl ester carboxylesterase